MGDEGVWPGAWSRGDSLTARRRVFGRLPIPMMRMVEQFADVHAAGRHRSWQEERSQIQQDQVEARVMVVANREEGGLRGGSDCKFSRKASEGMLGISSAVGANGRRRAEHERLELLEVLCGRVQETTEAYEAFDAADPFPWSARHIAMHGGCIRAAILSNMTSFSQGLLALMCRRGHIVVVAFELRWVLHCIIGSCIEGLALCDLPLFVFGLFPLRFVKASGLPGAPDEDPFVFSGAFLGWLFVRVAPAPVPVGFSGFSRGLPSKTAQTALVPGVSREERPPTVPTGFREQLLAARNWLFGASGRRDRGGGGGQAMAMRSRIARVVKEQAGAALALCGPLGLAVMLAAQDLAAHKRMVFEVQVLGGAWAFAHTGEVVDDCSYFARAGMAQSWPLGRRGSTTTNMAGARGHNRVQRDRSPIAAVLRLVVGPGSRFQFTSAHMASYEAGVEVQGWLAQLAPDSSLHRAVVQVQRLFPENQG